MIDHRRTPSQRAYQLPGWFFVLTAVLSVLAFTAVGWVFLADPFDPLRGAPQAKASPSASTAEAGPSPTAARAPSGAPAGGQSDNDGERSSIDVVVLNASGKPGLAADVAKAAKKAGWTVAEVGNWIYPAAVNAVYYPEGHQSEAELLAKDVEIESVRPTRSGMSTDDLTVLLVYSP
jgi:hypothetical protein